MNAYSRSSISLDSQPNWKQYSYSLEKICTGRPAPFRPALFKGLLERDTNCLRPQASTGGLGTYLPWIRRNSCATLNTISHNQHFIIYYVQHFGNRAYWFNEWILSYKYLKETDIFSLPILCFMFSYFGYLIKIEIFNWWYSHVLPTGFLILKSQAVFTLRNDHFLSVFAGIVFLPLSCFLIVLISC